MGLNSLIFHIIVTDSEANCLVDDAFSFITFTTFHFFLEILRIVLMNEHLGVVNSSLVKNICHLCCSLIPLVSEIKTLPSFLVSTISIFNLPFFFLSFFSFPSCLWYYARDESVAVLICAVCVVSSLYRTLSFLCSETCLKIHFESSSNWQIKRPLEKKFTFKLRFTRSLS